MAFELGALMVLNWPDCITEEEVKNILDRIVCVFAIHWHVCFINKWPKDYGYVVLYRAHIPRLLAHTVTINRRRLMFAASDNSVEVVYLCIKMKKDMMRYYRIRDVRSQIRPGHPNYSLPVSRYDPFVVEPPHPTRVSAHQLDNRTLLKIFLKLKLEELLRIERTCRRWQMIVMMIIGGHRHIDFSYKQCVWGAYAENTTHHPSEMVQKMLIVNGWALEILNFGRVFYEEKYIPLATAQIAPHLKTCTFIEAVPYEPRWRRITITMS